MRCSLAQALDVLGGDWAAMILRDIAAGITRFDAIQHSLGLSRKVLAERLEMLVDDGLVERVAYQERPPRHDYVLTERGAELAIALLALLAWGDRWASPEAGPPLLLRHERCGQTTTAQVTCACCGEQLRYGEVVPFVGPGFVEGPGTWESQAAFHRLYEAAGISADPAERAT
jgi:DNA-binding HxlR family transcriptional regulator